MTPEEVALHVLALQRAIQRGDLTNSQAVAALALVTWRAQGVEPTDEQIRARIPEVVDVAHFLGENPTPEEIDAACSFISRMGD